MFNRFLFCLVFSLGCSHSSKDKVEPIKIDGSSTVFPISEAVAEEFEKGSTVSITVASSGTGGGFKKFCAKEIDITGASRPIKPGEVEACKSNLVDYIELPVAYDGLVVVVNPKNDWVNSLSVEELKQLWQPEAQNTVKLWSQVRPGFPKKEIHLFGAGVDSGTYDYFTKAIVGEEHKSRGDYTSSEDDNVLVKGVQNDPLALGFFGFAYYSANKDSLKALAIDGGKGPVIPSVKTVENGTYQPLSRPIFIYVRKDVSERKEIQDLIHFYLNGGRILIKEVGYIPLPNTVYQKAIETFDSKIVGSRFSGKGSTTGVRL
jgi:phosphate transport system substrate-binding protein